jgi:hypothetical protein
VPNWYGQRVYCQFGEDEGPLCRGPFVSAQRIFEHGAFTFDSYLGDSRSEVAEINEFVRSVNELGGNVMSLTAGIFTLAGISRAHPQ